MIKNLVIIAIVVAIAATIAYQMGWLSGKGEDAYDNARDEIVDTGEKLIDKTRDAIE